MKTLDIDAAVKDLKRHIKEVTIDLDSEAYLEFMTQLANWAEDELERAEWLVEDDFANGRIIE